MLLNFYYEGFFELDESYLMSLNSIPLQNPNQTTL